MPLLGQSFLTRGGPSTASIGQVQNAVLGVVDHFEIGEPGDRRQWRARGQSRLQSGIYPRVSGKRNKVWVGMPGAVHHLDDGAIDIRQGHARVAQLESAAEPRRMHVDALAGGTTSISRISFMHEAACIHDVLA